MTKRRVLLYVVALAGLATIVIGILGHPGQAIATLAVAIMASFGWVVLWARAVNSRLTKISANFNRQLERQFHRQDVRNRKQVDRLMTALAPADAVGERVDTVDREIAAISHRVDAVGRKVDAVGRGVDTLDRRSQRSANAITGLRRQVAIVQSLVQRTPSATAELGRVYERIVGHDHPMPELGGFAMTSQTLVWIADQISSGRASTIMECGSGSSTVWFALALEQRGGSGHITSLESSADYADQTRARLAELGLAHRAQVLTAPLVELDLPGRPTQLWFDLSVLPDDVSDIDLLFVDGPVGNTSPQARYPALPVLAERLTDNAVVLLDDTNRADEKKIIEQWTTDIHAGRRFEVIRELDRATALRTVPPTGAGQPDHPARS